MLENTAFILNGPLDTTFATRPIPELAPSEVLVEVKKTGICGTDLHFYAEGKLADNIVTHPFSLGHESSGVVVKVSENVSGFEPGDRVAMEPTIKCRDCEECKKGKYQRCASFNGASVHPIDGTLQRYYKFHSGALHKLPDDLTLEDGAMMEPLSVAVHAVATIAKFKAGQNVLVFGAGPVGLLCMAVARALGAIRIIAVDIVPSRLDFAKSYVATDTFVPPKKDQDEKNITYAVRAANIIKQEIGLADRGPNSIDLAIDASGAETCIQMGVILARPGGTFLEVAGAKEVQFPFWAFFSKELTMKAAVAYGLGDYELAIKLVSSGKINLKPLVTHRYKFEDAGSAFETARVGKGVNEKGETTDAVKIIISGPDVSPLAH